MLGINPNNEINQREKQKLEAFIKKFEPKLEGKKMKEQKAILQEMTREVDTLFDYVPKANKLSTMISTTVANAVHEQSTL